MKLGRDKIIKILFINMLYAVSWKPLGAAPNFKDGDVFDHWTVRCEKISQVEGKQCFVFQNVVMKEGRQRVLHIAVGYLSKSDVPIAVLTLPLGISLPPGAQFEVKGREPLQFPIERCELKGCRAGFRFTADLLEDLKQVEEATVTFYDGSRQPVHVSVLLKGFWTGLDALKTE